MLKKEKQTQQITPKLQLNSNVYFEILIPR